jgi:uncharacterized membrane protein YkvA (DUF1232 family)
MIHHFAIHVGGKEAMNMDDDNNFWTIIIVIFLILLIISPIDPLPDPIPVVGQIDDAAAILGLLYLFTR